MKRIASIIMASRSSTDFFCLRFRTLCIIESPICKFHKGKGIASHPLMESFMKTAIYGDTPLKVQNRLIHGWRDEDHPSPFSGGKKSISWHSGEHVRASQVWVRSPHGASSSDSFQSPCAARSSVFRSGGSPFSFASYPFPLPVPDMVRQLAAYPLEKDRGCK